MSAHIGYRGRLPQSAQPDEPALAPL